MNDCSFLFYLCNRIKMNYLAAGLTRYQSEVSFNSKQSFGELIPERLEITEKLPYTN